MLSKVELNYFPLLPYIDQEEMQLNEAVSMKFWCSPFHFLLQYLSAVRDVNVLTDILGIRSADLHLIALAISYVSFAGSE